MDVRICLICAVFLFGAVAGQTNSTDTTNTSTTVEPQTSLKPVTTTVITDSAPVRPTTAQVHSTTVNDTITGNSTSSSSSPVTVTTGPEYNNTVTEDKATPPPPTGLSDGAIAGIAVGTIAGVGAIGGGVFGLLKYTGKI